MMVKKLCQAERMLE